MRAHKKQTTFRVLAVYKKSAFELFVKERKHPTMVALHEARHPQLTELCRAHDVHIAAMQKAKAIFQAQGIEVMFRYRADATLAKNVDMVVTLGGDGTLLWGSHLVTKDIPIMAINTAPHASVGFFCAGNIQHLPDLLQSARAGQLKATELNRMQVEMDGETISKRVLNDALFAHRHPASMTRYRIETGEHSQNQRSSGVWVGPAAGSTAALRSAGGRVLPITSKKIQFVVRELYVPGVIAAKRKPLRQGLIAHGHHLKFINQTRDAQLFMDGAHRKTHVPMGATLTFRSSNDGLTLLGFRRAQW